MEINKRQKKRYGWLLFFALVNWLAIGLVIWRVDPETIRDFIFPGSYFPMILLVMGGIFLAAFHFVYVCLEGFEVDFGNDGFFRAKNIRPRHVD